MTPTAIKRMDLVAFLSAFCLFLSTIEYIIPKPIPFIRIGLANLPILIALNLLPVPYILLLILLKVFGQALIQGTLFSYVFLFSLAGSFSSGMVMLVVKGLFKDHITLVGTSIMGALASNLSQIILAVYLIFGDSGWLMAPPLFGIGLVSSCLLGIFAQRFFRKSQWVQVVLHQNENRTGETAFG